MFKQSHYDLLAAYLAEQGQPVKLDAIFNTFRGMGHAAKCMSLLILLDEERIEFNIHTMTVNLVT